MLVAARSAGPAAIGVWSMAVAIQGYALQFGELGLRSVVTAEAARTRGGARALVGRYLVLRLATSTAVILAVLAVAAPLQPEHLGLMALVLLSLLAAAFQLDWVSLADGRSLAASLPLLVRPAGFLLALLAWPGGSTPSDIALAFLISWTAAAAVSLPALRLPARARGEAPALPAIGMLCRGVGFAAVSLLAQCQLGADLLVVGWTLGVEAAGNYYLASAVAVAATVLANAAGQLALARMGIGRGRPAAFRRGMRGLCAQGCAAGLAVAVALALAAPPLLSALLGGDFARASAVLPWLAPWVALVHLTTPLQGALGAVGLQRAALRANLASAAALAPLLGLAAWAGEAWAFALARSLAELVRLLLLLHASGLRTTGNEAHPGSGSRIVRFSGTG